MTLTKDELLHIPLFKLPGSFYGLGPVEAARITIGAVMAADTYAASYFGNAANPGGIIEVPGELTEEQASNIGRDWNITHSGPYRAGKIGVLTGGAAFKPLSLFVVVVVIAPDPPVGAIVQFAVFCICLNSSNAY